MRLRSIVIVIDGHTAARPTHARRRQGYETATEGNYRSGIVLVQHAKPD